jgi:tungstate transport system permease protein
MGTLAEGIIKALHLLLDPTRELTEVVMLTLGVSGTALFLASMAGIPLGAAIALRRFPLRGAIASALNALMGLPPVVAGLFIYLILSRSGPLGFMALLYTPSAMVIAQFVLAFPIVAALSASAIGSVPANIRLAARSLGATDTQAALSVIREARYGVLSAVMAAFGRVMAEVGAVLMVGGNIAGYTRVMTTTIALETDRGDFSLALALGLLLLAISLAVNSGVHALQRKVRIEHHA